MIPDNVQKWMDSFLDELDTSGRVPRLLLHSCCAPCSSYVIEYLSGYFNITVYYYNPNIYPENEYRFRVEEQKSFIRRFPVKNQVLFLEGDYDTNVFLNVVSGLEKEPEGGMRCRECFNLRLGETAKKAKELGFDYFATTLTISPLKNSKLINEIGDKIGKDIGVEYLPSEFRKKDGFLRSTQISEEYGMYRQNYCGCEYSIRD